MSDTVASDRRPAAGLAGLGAFLDQQSPGEAPVLIDTRMSQVLLAGPWAIKLRRPSPTLASAVARRAALARELRCNRRMSPTVYLGLAPVPKEAPVDWALVMRRLPGEQMLDQAIKQGTASCADIDRVAMRLSRFYAASRAVKIEPARVLARIDREQAHNRHLLMELAGRLSPARNAMRGRLKDLLNRSDTIWLRHRAEVALRVERGFIVDAHGDLRPEHICLTEPIELIDRLEFDRTLRCLDPWEELGLLGVLCAMAGAAWMGSRVAVAVEHTLKPPRPSRRLMSFYCAHHALVRARLAASHLREPRARRARHWRTVTRRLLGYAEAAVAGWDALSG